MNNNFDNLNLSGVDENAISDAIAGLIVNLGRAYAQACPGLFEKFAVNDFVNGAITFEQMMDLMHQGLVEPEALADEFHARYNEMSIEQVLQFASYMMARQ